MATDLMNAHPDLTGLVGDCTSSAPGVAQAVKDAGKIGKVFTVGLGTPKSMTPYLTGRLVLGVDPVGRPEPGLPDRVGRRAGGRGQAVRRPPTTSAPKMPGASTYDSATKVLLLGPPLTFTKDNGQPVQLLIRVPTHDAVPPTRPRKDAPVVRPRLRSRDADISKRYGGVPARSGRRRPHASSPGTVPCLVGENGAGKSTLIKIIAGAETRRHRDDRRSRDAPVTIGSTQRRDRATASRPSTRSRSCSPSSPSRRTSSSAGRSGAGGRVDWAAQNDRGGRAAGAAGPARHAMRPRRSATCRSPSSSRSPSPRRWPATPRS